MLLGVRISSYGCTWEVWRALKKLELISAAPRAPLTLLSCFPNFPRASITRYTHAKHEPILNWPAQYATTEISIPGAFIGEIISFLRSSILSLESFTAVISGGIFSRARNLFFLLYRPVQAPTLTASKTVR